MQQVPLVRALWFAKVTILKEFLEKDKSEVSVGEGAGWGVWAGATRRVEGTGFC